MPSNLGVCTAILLVYTLLLYSFQNFKHLSDRWARHFYKRRSNHRNTRVILKVISIFHKIGFLLLKNQVDISHNLYRLFFIFLRNLGFLYVFFSSFWMFKYSLDKTLLQLPKVMPLIVAILFSHKSICLNNFFQFFFFCLQLKLFDMLFCCHVLNEIVDIWVLTECNKKKDKIIKANKRVTADKIATIHKAVRHCLRVARTKFYHKKLFIFPE